MLFRSKNVKACAAKLGDRLAGILANMGKKAPKSSGGGSSGGGKATTGIDGFAGVTTPDGTVTGDADGLPTVNGAKVSWAGACGSVSETYGMKLAQDSDHPKDENKAGLAITGNSAKRVFEAYLKKAGVLS